MSNPHSVASEELLDKHQLVFALTMFCVGFTLGTSAIRELVSPDSSLYGLLSALRAGGVIASALLALYLIWQKISYRRSCMQGQFLESFVQYASLRAMAISWASTFAALVFMNGHIDSGAVLPTDFYTKLATAVLLLSFSLSYFLLTRTPSEVDES